MWYLCGLVCFALAGIIEEGTVTFSGLVISQYATLQHVLYTYIYHASIIPTFNTKICHLPTQLLLASGFWLALNVEHQYMN